MVIETDEGGWAASLDLKAMPVFFQPEYLNVIRLSFNVGINYFVVKNEGRTIAGLAVFTKNKNIVSPEHLGYASLWFSPLLNERKKVQALKELISLFKSSYRKISLKLNPNVTDIRPFIWGVFNVESRYTYLKDTAVAPHFSIRRNLKDASVKQLTLHAGPADGESIQLNLSILNTLAFSKKKVAGFQGMMTGLADKSLLYSFDVLKDGEVVSSSLVLLDGNVGKAYLLFVSQHSPKVKYAHTFLYQQIIDWLHRHQYNQLDFCGANIESIANFKSFFNPQLVPYYVVKYSALRARFKPLLKLLDRL